MERLGMLARPAPTSEKPEQPLNAEFYEDTEFHLSQHQQMSVQWLCYVLPHAARIFLFSVGANTLPSLSE